MLDQIENLQKQVKKIKKAKLKEEQEEEWDGVTLHQDRHVQPIAGKPKVEPVQDQRPKPTRTRKVAAIKVETKGGVQLPKANNNTKAPV